MKRLANLPSQTIAADRACCEVQTPPARAQTSGASELVSDADLSELHAWDRWCNQHICQDRKIAEEQKNVSVQQPSGSEPA